MSHGVLLYPNWLDTGPVRFWGGSWLRQAPLELLRDQRRVYAAVSRSACRDDTWFRIDLGQPRNVMGWAFPWQKLSKPATITVRGFWDGACTLEVPEAAVVDKEVYPVIYPWGTVPREHPSARDGKITDEEIARSTVPVLHVYRTEVVCQGWEVRISDPTSPAHRIRLPRMFLAGGYRPTRNFDWGAAVGLRDASIRSTGVSGVDFYDEREQRHAAQLAFPDVAYNEAWAWMHDMREALGTSKQFFFSYDPDDLPNLHRHSFPCTMDELDDLTAIRAGFMSTAYKLRGVVG